MGFIGDVLWSIECWHTLIYVKPLLPTRFDCTRSNRDASAVFVADSDCPSSPQRDLVRQFHRNY